MRSRVGIPSGRGVLYASLFLVLCITLFLMFGPTGWPSSSTILTLRILRGVAALLAGMTLAVNGASLQALLVNPLADPYILGIASGSAFGYALGLVLGIRSISVLSIPANSCKSSETASFFGRCSIQSRRQSLTLGFARA